MELPLGPISRNFLVLSSHERPALCLPRVEATRADWVLIERPMTRWEYGDFTSHLGEGGPGSEWLAPFLENPCYYYALHPDQLLDFLKGADQEYVCHLHDVLGLRERDSNDLSITDGFVFNPAAGTLGHSYLGRFAPMATVVLEAGLPVGIETPPLLGYEVRTGQEKETPPPPVPPVHEPPGGAEAAPLIEATLAAEFPRILAVGEVGNLEVTLAAGDQPLPGEQTKIKDLSTRHEVVVRLSLSPNLKLDSGELFSRIEPPTAEDSRNLLYEVRALEAGPAQVTIRLFQPGRGAEQIGFLKLRPTIAPGPVATASSLRATAGSYPPSGCPAPDLVLYIEEYKNGGTVTIRFSITAGPDYPEPFEDRSCGEKVLDRPPDLYFQTRFAKIEGMPFYTPEHAEAVAYMLRAEGRQLYEDLLSEEIRQEFKERGHRITSIQIKTDGHHIPWEMILLPASERDGVQRPEQFLAERYQVTRWTESYGPPGQIHLRNLLYVAPQYQAGRRLDFAKDEVAYLEGTLGGLGVRVQKVEARPLPIFKAIDNEAFDVFHFVGHAFQADGQSALELETEELTIGHGPTETKKKIVHNLPPNVVLGKGTIWGPRRPLIFFNACQTGRQDIGLVRPGGWVKNLLSSKAGAFVGTLWSVLDRTAPLFCRTFYDALLAGKTFGESALVARGAVAATGDPSWLAYVVYAHPNARLALAAPAAAVTGRPG
jgi:hypothetical protein